MVHGRNPTKFILDEVCVTEPGPLAFINDDTKVQLDVTRDVLAEGERLLDLAQRQSDPVVMRELVSAARALTVSANQLTANVRRTTDAALAAVKLLVR